ncbi:hypothetical protein ECPA28_3586 [Escherichia coli PA28]|nr:hypothetical protein ECPA28_3586 [Escherichia coli PA28]
MNPGTGITSPKRVNQTTAGYPPGLILKGSLVYLRLCEAQK